MPGAVRLLSREPGHDTLAVMWRSRLAWSYLFAVALVWALGELVGERTVPTLLLAYAPPLVWLLPAPLVLAWTLCRRRGRGVALVGTLLAVGGAGLLHARPQESGSLRVVTWNVAHGMLGTADQVAGALRAANPDIILLQEANFVPRGFGEALSNGLPGYTPLPGQKVLTFSRLPVLENRELPLPGSGRTVLETGVRWRGQTLRMVNVHLDPVFVSSVLERNWDDVRYSDWLRVGQVVWLCQLVSRLPDPVLIGGDLNTPPRGRLYRQIQGCVGQDAHNLAGRGPGWTFPGLFLRIDHLLARGLTPTRTQVLPDSGSDHRPLLVEYR